MLEQVSISVITWDLSLASSFRCTHYLSLYRHSTTRSGQVGFHPSDPNWSKAGRAQAEAAHTQRVLLSSLQTLVRGHAGLDAAVAFASLTAALTQLGLEGAMAVLRQRPERLGLPPPSRAQRLRQRVAGERAKDSPLVTRLDPEVRAYAIAQAKASAGRGITECRRDVKQRENTLRAARDAQERATPERRRTLSKEQRAALTAYELGRGRGREVADRGLER